MNVKYIIAGVGFQTTEFMKTALGKEILNSVEFACDSDKEKQGKNYLNTPIQIKDYKSLENIDDTQYNVLILSTKFYEEIALEVRKYNKDIKIISSRKIIIENKRNKLLDAVESNKGKVSGLNDIEKWLSGAIISEASWWSQAILEWNETQRNRFNKKEFKYTQEDITQEILAKPKCSILDIGSGPYSKFGNLNKGKEMNYIMIDPLAYQYRKIREENHLDTSFSPSFGVIECLDCFYSKESIDYIIIHNALDHMLNAVQGIIMALDTLKIGGKLLTQHFECEGAASYYTGLHQWDITLNDKDEYILADSVGTVWNISSIVKEFADIHVERITCNNYNDIIIANIKKKKSVPQSIKDKYIYEHLSGDIIHLLFEKQVKSQSK